MRISDWSSDVCSSDLLVRPLRTLPMNRGNDPSANMKENIMSDTNQNRPSHRLFTVNGEAATARRTAIGVACETRHGTGFPLHLQPLPLTGHVFLRINHPQDEPQSREQRPLPIPLGTSTSPGFPPE